MVKLEPFAIEHWMSKYDATPNTLNVAEVCAASISLDELCALNSDKAAPGPFNPTTKLTYGAVPGSETLRRNIAALYNRDTTRALSPDDVIVCQGTIAANFLVYFSLLGPGDHVVSVYPAFQQLYSLPKSFGAEVTLWRLKKENGFVPDVRELEGLVKTNTKIITLNNPHNPSGSTFPRDVVADIVAFAQKRGIIILSDEIYRPLFHSLPEGEEAPPSILSFGYDQVVSTSSMSKCFSLAGLRLGWVATRDQSIKQAVQDAREYSCVTVSQLDDQVASYALSATVLPNILERNMSLARTNLALLEAFVTQHSAHCSWTKPTAGTMAFVEIKDKDGSVVNDAEFCIDLLEKTKVYLVPGSVAFGGGDDFKGYVRFGYVCHTAVLQEALHKLGRYFEQFL